MKLHDFLLSQCDLDLSFLEVCVGLFQKQFSHYGDSVGDVTKDVFDF